MPLDNIPAPRLEARLRRELRGEVMFDAFTRGRYATDASIYQIEPLGVAVPKDKEDIAVALQIAREEGVPVLPRGGGTSQCGQTVARALVLDCSKYMQQVVALDTEARRVRVQPGRRHGAAQRPAAAAQIVVPGRCLDRRPRHDRRHDRQQQLRRALDPLRQHGAQRARDRRDPGRRHGGAVCRGSGQFRRGRAARALSRPDPRHARAAPPRSRRDRGALPETAAPGRRLQHRHDFRRAATTWRICWSARKARSASFTEIELDLQPIPPHRVLGICHFPTFYQAMDATQHIVKLDPAAVELVDRTMIELARDNPVFRATSSTASCAANPTRSC